ncbi:MAG: hypothetical protein ABII00_02655 [Elusimicrobiota bacterium]
MTTGPGGETLIDSGHFRVDRKRALHKLIHFQMPDPGMFPLPWVQAAVASGARAIEVSTSASGFEMAFDGDDWDPRDFRDPYGHLFEGDPAGGKTRNRELAIGLLSALRILPERVTIMFAQGDMEYVLSVKSPTEEDLSPAPQRPLENLRKRFGLDVRMYVRVGKAGTFQKEREHLRELCRHCPVPIRLQRSVINPPADPNEAVLSRTFEKGGSGIAGEVRLSPRTLGTSRLEFVINGVTVTTEHPELPGVQLEGFVRDDGLRKSISQAGIVRDGRYRAAMEAFSSESKALLKDAVVSARRLAPRVGALLKAPSARRHWMPWGGRSLGERIGSFLTAGLEDPGGMESSEHSVLRMSLIVGALREACVRHRFAMAKNAPGIPELLWNAAVLFDETGKPLTLRELQDQSRWLTRIPFAEGRSPAPFAGLTAAWTICAADKAFLERFFPSQVQQVGVDEMGGAAVTQPVLEQKNLLAKRRFHAERIFGEVGLSLTPHPRQTRIQWFNERHTIGRSLWPMEGLRMEAAVLHPTVGAVALRGRVDAAAAECLSAITAAAPGLYEDLARAYDPGDAGPRQAMIREHLLDFLAGSWGGRERTAPRHAWIADLALLRAQDGTMLSVRDLTERAAHGRKTTLLPSPHPELIQKLFLGYPDHMKRLFEGSPLASIASPPKPARPVARPISISPARKPPKPAPKAPVPEPSKPPPSADESKPPELIALGPAAPEGRETPQHPAARPAWSTPGAPGENLVMDRAGDLKAWLRALKKRGACPLADEMIDRISLVDEGSGKLIRLTPDRGCELNAEHPLLKALQADYHSSARLPYLASVAFTAINRVMKDVTDAHDTDFSMALADLVLETDKQ